MLTNISGQPVNKKIFSAVSFNRDKPMHRFSKMLVFLVCGSVGTDLIASLLAVIRIKNRKDA